MARIVLPIAGSIIGGSIGGPVGARIGYALGSLAGNAIDPLVNQGPRIGEIPLQTAQEGAYRPIVYGTYPVSGNIIATGPVVKRTVRDDGKGGPVNETEEARQTFAIRICEGEIAAITRLWVDEKLVVDLRPGSTILADSYKFLEKLTLYLGTASQLPDPDLEAIFGIGTTAAHRRTAYAVFPLFNITEYGNRIPNFRWEVAMSATVPAFGAFTGPTELPGSTVNNTGFSGIAVHAEVDDTLAILGGGWGDAVFFVEPGEQYQIRVGLDGVADIFSTRNLTNAGDGIGSDYLMMVGSIADGWGISQDGSSGYTKLIRNGSQRAYLTISPAEQESWWFGLGDYGQGDRVWFHSGAVYIGARESGSPNTLWDALYRWPLQSSGGALPATHSATGVSGDGSGQFTMHVDRSGVVRVVDNLGNLKSYDSLLNLISTVALPAPVLDGLVAFGVEGNLLAVVQASVTGPVGDTDYLAVYDLTTFDELERVDFGTPSVAAPNIAPFNNRVLFTSSKIIVQRGKLVWELARFSEATVGTDTLSNIVTDICRRRDIDASEIDVSELTDEVAGFGLLGDYDGAAAIEALMPVYLFDCYSADGKLWFPKRGGAVKGTITEDDLVDDPDTTDRADPQPMPKKLLLEYQNATIGYAPAVAPSTRESQDARVVGQRSIQVPVVLDSDAAQTTVERLHNIAWDEAGGEIKLSVPAADFAAMTCTDRYTLQLRGLTRTIRVTKTRETEGVLEIEALPDRASAVGINAIGPVMPPPTVTPSLGGPTIFFYGDLPDLRDEDDNLGHYVAGSGVRPAYPGYQHQRSVEGGDFVALSTYRERAVMGFLEDGITAGSPFVTDTTNVLRVKMISGTFETISTTQWLREGGGIVVKRDDGTAEIIQARDAADVGGGVFELTHLIRGRLNTGATAHAAGAMVVALDSLKRVSATTAQIGAQFTDRPVTLGTSPETTAVYENVFTPVGSQIEMPVASLSAVRVGSDIVANWSERRRFGTSVNPIRSINWQGYRVTLDDGATVVTFDQTTERFTYDATALGGTVAVRVAQINRLTGAGPSEEVSV